MTEGVRRDHDRRNIGSDPGHVDALGVDGFREHLHFCFTALPQ
jgi:hypothetical protein